MTSRSTIVKFFSAETPDSPGKLQGYCLVHHFDDDSRTAIVSDTGDMVLRFDSSMTVYDKDNNIVARGRTMMDGLWSFHYADNDEVVETGHSYTENAEVVFTQAYLSRVKDVPVSL